ncbi:helix-turn-helix domain-containing protein [Nonomuraea phyllanthi]|uniref:helix-turn-helix domain-containing protein n=1 Tax=Nonomuraea phyllanthi TaxID=2219224 RepID=UPI001D150F73|nr:helix-turn-helix domain-containing protein [Nonomuraea phyllanthi]
MPDLPKYGAARRETKYPRISDRGQFLGDEFAEGDHIAPALVQRPFRRGRQIAVRRADHIWLTTWACGAFGACSLTSTNTTAFEGHLTTLRVPAVPGEEEPPIMTPATLDDAQLYRVTDAIRLLPLSRTVIYEQIRNGRLRSVKQGRARLITANGIRAYIVLLEREAEEAS